MTTQFLALRNMFTQSAQLAMGLGLCVFLLTGCQATQTDEESPQLRKAKQLIEQGDFEAAFVQLNQALNQAPRDPNLHLNLGWLYLYTGDPDSATRELAKVESLAPELAETYHLRGYLLSYRAQKSDDPKQAERLQHSAITNFNQALERDRKNNQTYFDLATSLTAINRDDEALTVLDKGFQHIPDDDLKTQVNFQIATCAARSRLQLYEEAIEDCNQALEFTTNPASRERITEMVENMKLMNPGLSVPAASQAERDQQAEEQAVVEESSSD
ncbi:tetratricopeptide repeat protein [Vampirovibrio sp.]|uniref:tetratricopeptide repeat protein n=1 Tax=Vampirovibrio sp. TaxID=2717857 RepID=UPI0035948368